jgi:hypothetical protein
MSYRRYIAHYTHHLRNRRSTASMPLTTKDLNGTFASTTLYVPPPSFGVSPPNNTPSGTSSKAKKPHPFRWGNGNRQCAVTSFHRPNDREPQSFQMKHQHAGFPKLLKALLLKLARRRSGQRPGVNDFCIRGSIPAQHVTGLLNCQPYGSKQPISREGNASCLSHRRTFRGIQPWFQSEPRGTRTPNPLIKSQLLCQIELAAHACIIATATILSNFLDIAHVPCYNIPR